MRKTVKILIVSWVITLFSLTQCVGAQVEYTPDFFAQLARGRNAIPQIRIPAYQKIICKNGMVVYLAEDHEVPVILMSGFLRWGRSRETPQTAGISDVMIDMMNTGTRKYGERRLERYKQLHAVSFGIKADDHNFSFSGNALSAEKEALVSLSAEILRRPKFTTDYFQRTKNEWIKSLNQQKTQEDALLKMYFYRNIFQGHVYSYPHDLDMRLANLDTITPEQLDSYYQRSILPNHTILAVYGDFTTQSMARLIKKYFGSWAKKEVVFTAAAKAQENEATYGQILLVDKPDATHAKLVLGQQFVDDSVFNANLKERVALEIGNQVFGGGGFESYLMDEIRSKKGYAYAIDADYSCAALGGAYFVSTSVKPEKACETIEIIKQLITALKTGKRKIGQSEVGKIINYWNAFFPESFRDKDKIIANVMYGTEIKKWDADWLNQYIRAYNRVTAAEAQEAFTKYLFPEKLFTVIVGKSEDILPQFTERGMKVKVISN
jgi:zinc protease